MLKKINIGDKIYFGRGPLEFTGTVMDILYCHENISKVKQVSVLGAELGCNKQKKELQVIGHVDGINVITDDEFIELIKNELCFDNEKAEIKALKEKNELSNDLKNNIKKKNLKV